MSKINCIECNKLCDEDQTLFNKCPMCNREEELLDWLNNEDLSKKENTIEKTNKESAIKNKGTGAGGSKTNENGLSYEKITDLDDKMNKMTIVDRVSNIKKQGIMWLENNLLNSTMAMTQPGSLTFGLWGSTPSKHSISIKFGMFGEFMFKKVIENTEEMELLKCGIQIVNEKGKKKDIDMIWVDKQKKTLRYRELKGNIEMDSEKIPATIDKINDDVVPYIKKKYRQYEDFNVDIGILAWGIYNREGLKKGLSHIKKCEKENVKVEHVEDFFKSVNFDWSKDDYNQYIRFLGTMIKDALF